MTHHRVIPLCLVVITALVAACGGNTAAGPDETRNVIPYPIHLHFVDNPSPVHPIKGVHPDIQHAAEEAAEEWSRILAPSPRAPFTLRHDTSCGNIDFEAGQVFEAGLHVYVIEDPPYRPGGAAAGAALCKRTIWEKGDSAVPMPPVGVVWVRGPQRGLTGIVSHEIGHVLGIGYWDDGLVKSDDKIYYLDHPGARRVFSRMGGSELPAHVPRVPLDPWGLHWDYCTGVPDNMTQANLPAFNLITELTVVALAPGYRYDRALVNPRVKLDPSWWNKNGYCRDGSSALSTLSQTGSATSPVMMAPRATTMVLPGGDMLIEERF